MSLPAEDQPAAPAAVEAAAGSLGLAVRRHIGATVDDGIDRVAVEAPVALLYDGEPHAVMMMTPRDLEAFALGFTLSEGLCATPAEVASIRTRVLPGGFEVGVWLAPGVERRMRGGERAIPGRSGCGLCGVRLLEEALDRPSPVVRDAPFEVAAVRRALAGLAERQSLNAETGAVHAAGWSDRSGALVAVCEDVGRHNALDKLIGTLATAGVDPRSGFAVVTSRASYELVQKSARVGIGLLAAVSGPTSLAVELANCCNLTLVGFARGERQTVYAHPEGLRGPASGA